MQTILVQFVAIPPAAAPVAPIAGPPLEHALPMTTLDIPTIAFAQAPTASRPMPAPTAGMPVASEPTVISLSDLDIGGFATIHAVLPTDNDADRDLVLRLIEIGFVPGERVRVIAAGQPGRQPLAVRLSATDSGRRSMSGATFAMRRHEASFIRVVPDLPTSTRTDHE